MKKKGAYSIVREETYDDGQTVFEEDSHDDGVYIILHGAVETSRTVKGRKFTMEELKPDDVFGQSALIGGMRRSVTAQAKGKTILGVIDPTSLKNEYSHLSKQFRSILETLPQRHKKILTRACDLSD